MNPGKIGVGRPLPDGGIVSCTRSSRSIRFKNLQGSTKYLINNFIQDITSFAKRLPIHPRELILVIVTHKKTTNNHPAFIVCARRIRRALVWLKLNNIQYKDIETNEQVLAGLPENSNVQQMLRTLGIAETAEDMLNAIINEQIHDTGVPRLEQVDHAGQIQTVLGSQQISVPYPELTIAPITNSAPQDI